MSTRTFGEHKADSLVIRLGLDEQSLIPTDLLFNSEEKQDDRGVQVPDHLGKRLPHDIIIEQYGPSQWEDFEGSEEQNVRGVQELATRVNFFSGIPAVASVKGILHLYKSPELTLSEMVCVLCIPAQMRLLDMLEFLSPVLKTITNIRVVRDATPNQYMMLLKFKIKEAAHSFFIAYNGKRYNSLEKGICQMSYISRVEIVKPPLRGVRKGLVELPSCPVCLERLDDSVLTILCNHSFHTNCLTQWQESTTCPVCRYMYTPDPVGGDNTCSSCDSKEDLWICLICGVVGCGRYVGGHANNHFVKTQHTFAMHLDTGRVWDYAGDNYVHRLVQNKSDGKLVEVSGMSVAGEEKIDSIQLEYTYLLTTQLESQRLFFEEKIARFEKEANEQLVATQSRCRDLMAGKDTLEEEVLALRRDKLASEKKYSQLQEKVSKLSQELNEEREVCADYNGMIHATCILFVCVQCDSYVVIIGHLYDIHKGFLLTDSR